MGAGITSLGCCNCGPPDPYPPRDAPCCAAGGMVPSIIHATGVEPASGPYSPATWDFVYDPVRRFDGCGTSGAIFPGWWSPPIAATDFFGVVSYYYFEFGCGFPTARIVAWAAYGPGGPGSTPDGSYADCCLKNGGVGAGTLLRTFPMFNPPTTAHPNSCSPFLLVESTVGTSGTPCMTCGTLSG